MPSVNRSSRAMAAGLGVLAGLGGITHGVGEMLQGSVAPSGIIISSWTQGPIAEYMGGEPAMTIVPNVLVTGILAILSGMAIVVWSAAFTRRRIGGSILVILSVAMLLLGGGFAPPVMGILAGFIGRGMGARRRWWRERMSEGLRHFLSRAWTWVYAITLVDGIFLVVGSVLLVYLANLNAPDLFVGSFLVSVPLILLSALTGAARDAERSPPAGEDSMQSGRPPG